MNGGRASASRLMRTAAAAATAVFLCYYCCCAVAADDAAEPQPCPVDDGCAAIRCPSDRDACPLGLVPDGCSCCPYGVCGLGETSVCNAVDRPCADHLECVETEDEATTTSAGTARTVYRCACKENEFACGSDNKTYSNACQLNEATAGYNGSVWMQYSGPCQSAPVVRSAPKNFAGSVGQPVVLDCEVNGYPVPSVSWRFTDAQGITKWLPGDDTVIAIQTRGGPDRLTVTSWVQIMEFKSVHVGNYTCLGTNSVDTSAASAVLDVLKMT